MKRFALRKAFTIVEMVIVIAVIAILATVLVPTISGVINKANLSADQQFVASLNIQLKLWELDNHTISSEADLQKAINHYYNDDLPGFYESLKPKSANQRFHFWFDVQNGMVVVGTYEMLTDINGDGVISTNVDPISRTFSPASPRNLILDTDDGPKQYFLMDQEGSELADMIAGMENLAKDAEGQDYEELITDLAERSADENNDEKELYAAIAEKISKTTIVTNSCAYRYSDPDDIKYVWIVPSAGMLTEAEVFVYDGTEVNDGTSGAALSSNVKDIELPDRVYVGVGGLNVGSLVSDLDDNNNNGTENYSNSVRLHVNTTEISELQKIYATDCVLVTPSGARYVWVGDKLYPLPIQMNDGTPTTTPVGRVDSGSMQIDQIKIECSDGVAANPNEGKVYLSNGILYAAYDKGTVQLALSGGLSNSMVTWTSDNEEVATVDSTGKVTLKLPAVEQGATYKATITAAYNYDETNTASIEVFVVRPVSVALTLGGQSLSIPATNNAVTLTYTDNTEFKVGETVSVEYSQRGYVQVDGAVSYSTSGDMFTVNPTTGTVTVNPEKITSSSQTLTVTYKNGDTTYLTQDFAVTVMDNSASSFKVNYITDTDTVEMGATYLFRVGNGNTFTLDKLFNSDKPGDNITLKIYDASKTSGTGGNGPIASDSGFWAKVNNTAPTYEEVDGKQVYKGWTLTKDTWAASTIQFGGTGVAIIEITTPKGTAKLAVEVVNGNNIYSGGSIALSGSANNVLLSDIELNSGFALQKGKTVWGNGFKIDVTACGNTSDIIVLNTQSTLDNVRVVGAVYTTLSDAYNTAYYAAVVRMESGSTISNSYISNGRVPVRVGGTATIVNTTLSGGRMANLELRAGTLTLKNVTTINQANANDKASNGSTVVGLGILVRNDTPDTARIIIEGNLVQHNFISKNDPLPDDTRVDAATNLMFNDSSFSTMRFSYNSTAYVNSGIIFLNSTQNLTSAPSNYICLSKNVTALGKTVYVYSYDNTKYSFGADSLTTEGWKPDAQNVVEPEFSYSGLGSSKENDREYMYYTPGITYDENGEIEYYGAIYLGSTSGEVTIEDVLNGVNVSKYTGQTFAVNVTTSGNLVGNKVTFKEDGYITYTVTDTRFYNNTGAKNENASTVYRFTIKVVLERTSLPKAVISATGGSVYWLSNGNFLDPDYHACIPVLDGVTINDENGNLIWSGDGQTAIPEGLTITVTFIQSAGSNMNVYTDYVLGSTLYYQTTGVSDGYHGGSTGWLSLGAKNNTQAKYTVTYNYKSDQYSAAESVTVVFNSNGSENKPVDLAD